MRERMVWWRIAMCLLGCGSIVCVVSSYRISAAHFQRLGHLLNAIEHDPEAWQGITIGGDSPILFYKNLWVDTSVMMNLNFVSHFFLAVLVLLLILSLFFEKRKRGTK